MDLHKIRNTTLQFYSHFCGTNIAELESGIHFIRSPERDKPLKGLGENKYSLFILVKDALSVISYSPDHQAFVDGLTGHSTEEILSAAKQSGKFRHMRLFLFHGETVFQYGNAKILEASDYPLFETFFRSAYPSANPDGWLHEYFSEKAAKEYLAGYMKEGRLVSVCDAPDMPYMEDQIQHTGIMTLPEERRKGYARSTAALSTHHLLEMGVCPQWECSAQNTASCKLAQALGYREYAQAYIWEEHA